MVSKSGGPGDSLFRSIGAKSDADLTASDAKKKEKEKSKKNKEAAKRVKEAYVFDVTEREEAKPKLSKSVKPLQTPPAVPVPYTKPTKGDIKDNIKSLNKKMMDLKNEAFKLTEQTQTLENLLNKEPEMLPKFQQYQLDYSNLMQQVEAGGDKWKNKPEIQDKLQELNAPIKALEIYRAQLRLQTYKKKIDSKKELEEAQKASSSSENPSTSPTEATRTSTTPKYPPPTRKPPPPPSNKVSKAEPKRPTPEPAQKKSEMKSETLPLEALAPPSKTADKAEIDALKRSLKSKLDHCWDDLYVPALIKDTKSVKGPEDLKFLKEKSSELVALHTEIKTIAEKIPKSELTSDQQDKLTRLSRQIGRFNQYLDKLV